MSIRVIKPGALTSLQDLGRFGFQRYGVITGGVMDEWSHRTANLLVGNAQSEATLEITLLGPSLVFDERTLFAITGADLSPRIGEHAVPQERPVLVRAGAQLDFGRRLSGCRAYLAVRGGYAVRPIMGSKSTYLRGGFGGFEGRALRKGDVVRIGARNTERHYPRLHHELQQGGESFCATPDPVVRRMSIAGDDAQTIRVVAGPQWSLFADDARAQLLGTEFVVTSNSDRMGYRLQGAKLVPREAIEMISEGVSFGAIQVPPDGNPIILMADCQTSGGYPKIAAVASVDQPVLAQAMPQQRLRFELISLDDAQNLYLARERELARIAETIERLKRGA